MYRVDVWHQGSDFTSPRTEKPSSAEWGVTIITCSPNPYYILIPYNIYDILIVILTVLAIHTNKKINILYRFIRTGSDIVRCDQTSMKMQL